MTPEEENKFFLKDCIDNLDLLPKSRDEALSLGVKLFIYRKGCRNGHSPVRFTSDNRCAVCKRRSFRKNFLMNKKKRYKEAVEYQKKRYREQPSFKASCILRDSVKRAFSLIKANKTSKTFQILGYSLEDFIDNIEQKFKEGMSWGNHGSVWELDHIVPMAAFDLEQMSHFMFVNSFDNLQPLFKDEHAAKTKEDVLRIQEYRKSGVLPDVWEILSTLQEM